MSTTNILPNPRVDELTWTRAPAPSGHWLQIMLLVTTLLTTTAVGARYMYNFELGNAPLTSFTDLFPFAWIWEIQTASEAVCPSPSRSSPSS
jgi:hypothetical protein